MNKKNNKKKFINGLNGKFSTQQILCRRKHVKIFRIKYQKNILKLWMMLNKHNIESYLLEEAGIFGGGTDICGICDS